MFAGRTCDSFRCVEGQLSIIPFNIQSATCRLNQPSIYQTFIRYILNESQGLNLLSVELILMLLLVFAERTSDLFRFVI